MSVNTCIYCRSTRATRFPKEHVLPQAFGHFQNNLTLDCVCGECNKLFSKELELFLTRDSVEALLRVRYGLKTKGGRRKLGKSRLIIKVISPGDWHGARILVERNSTGSALFGRPLPQVAFRKLSETKWKWFLEEELERAQGLEVYRKDVEIAFVGTTEDEIQRLRAKLYQLGVVRDRFKTNGIIERRPVFVEVFAESMLDDIVFRGVGKIALNFLAYLRDADFALRNDFDQLRNYIRFGAKPASPHIAVSKLPILNGDDLLYRQTTGHTIVLDWDPGNRGIVCLVQLFNHLTYHIILCENYTGIWHPLGGGRHFDLPRLTISELTGISRLLLPERDS